MDTRRLTLRFLSALLMLFASDGVAKTPLTGQNIPEDVRVQQTSIDFRVAPHPAGPLSPCQLSRFAGATEAPPLRWEEDHGNNTALVASKAWDGRDKTLLFRALFSNHGPTSAMAVTVLGAFLVESDFGLLVGLLRHPSPRIRAAGLRLAGRGGFSGFLPELRTAATRSEEPTKAAAIDGLRHLQTLGSQAILKDLGLTDSPWPPIQPPDPSLERWCRKTSEKHGKHEPMHSLMRRAFKEGLNGQGRPHPSLPPAAEWAYLTGVELAAGEKTKVWRRIRHLKTQLRLNPCATHPCDALLLQEMRNSALSIFHHPL